MMKPRTLSTKWLLGLLISGSFIFACGNQEQAQEGEATAMEEEAPAQENNEWETLALDAWRNYRADTISPVWQESDGVIELTGKGGGDIITKKQYENFELSLDWKISEGGNSGIFFRVIEADTLGAVYHSGPEVQVLDNERHRDAKIITHRAGDNYDLQASSVETVKPAGEWNSARLIVKDGHVEHWLNGTKVVEYQIGSPEWEEQYQKSKFTKWPEYARNAKGHLALQDHGDKVWFRNIKVKEL